MDNLARNALLATQAGMSYGKWKALQPIVEPKKKELPEGWRVCPVCGTEFTGQSSKKFCCKKCQVKDYHKRVRKTNKEYAQKGRRVAR